VDLDQRLDPEAVLTEEPDPLAVGQVELDRLVASPVDAMQAEVRHAEPTLEEVGLDVPAKQ